MKFIYYPLYDFEVPLEEHLTPDSSDLGIGAGQIEDLQWSVRQLLLTTGKLLALMVEKDLLSLEEATQITGNYRTYEVREKTEQ